MSFSGARHKCFQYISGPTPDEVNPEDDPQQWLLQCSEKTQKPKNTARILEWLPLGSICHPDFGSGKCGQVSLVMPGLVLPLDVVTRGRPPEAGR